MSEKKTLADRVLDVYVYGPIGFALEARELLPKLAERGRGQFNSQIAMAKVMGEFAVKAGRSEAEKRITKAQSSASVALSDLGLWPSPEEDAPVVIDTTATNGAVKPAATATAPTAAEPAPDAEELAIPDYDGLAASQVVPRLEGLAVGELESVRLYEAAHRGRKTVLGKIAQLQSA